MDDEGFESALIETLITQQDNQPIHILTSLPTPNPIVYKSDITHTTQKKDIKDIEKTYKCIYKKQYGVKQNNQLSKFINLNDLQQPKITQNQTSPLFDSNFIHGNLAAVFQVNDIEFDLVLEEDINTSSYSQWFYFRVHNLNEQLFQFNIINLSKYYQQYQNGFGVYIKIDNQWTILKTQVRIKESTYVTTNFCRSESKLYTLTFFVNKKLKKFEIALGIPYTHLDLDQYLTNFQTQTIATTYSGLPVKMIQFGSKKSDVILVIARQHPGETVSSHVCQGFLDQISNDKTLQMFYNVIVIPMINPDGVKWGNFRCDLSGKDLNRVWQCPRTKVHQQIIEIKNLITKILEEGRDIKSFIDLHGHSKRLGTFMYACRNEDDPLQCRVLPKIMQKYCKYFDFQSCTFNLKSYKLKTARALVYEQVQKYFPDNFHNVITLETSFFGYEQNDKYIQYKQEDLYQIGKDLHDSLRIYYTQNHDKNKILQELKLNEQQYEEQDQNESISESDSDAEIGLNQDNQIQNFFENQEQLSLRSKFKELKRRTYKKSNNPFLVGQCEKQFNFHKLTRRESQSQKIINKTINQPSTPSLRNLNKANRNLSSHTKNTHFHSSNNDFPDQTQSCRGQRYSNQNGQSILVRTPKEFLFKQEQRQLMQSPSDKHIIFESNLKITRKNTQILKIIAKKSL